MKIKAIITGSTGMVGEGVLRVCLESNDVESVLLVNRRQSGIEHPKIEEIIVDDFINLSLIKEKVKEYNACYFCAGVSSVGMDKEKYKHITYNLTMNFAKTLIEAKQNNAEKIDMVFNYVSGAGTDSTEKGRLAWARVKGKLENDLMKLPFRDAYMFRPGFIKYYPGQTNVFKVYKALTPLYPLLRRLYPGTVGTMEELGKSMINVTLYGYKKKVLEVKDIRESSKV